MSQSVAVGPIPLEKYSFALSNENVRHHVWHHNTRRDILLLKVVREPSMGSSYGNIGLQVIIAAGTEPLERLNTQKLVDWARDHEQRVRQGLVTPQTEHPVQVVVKFPCIAMRYPAEPPMVRRFQLKFGTEGDYLTVRDTLRDLGFPIKESTGVSRPVSRASTAAPRTGVNRLTSSSPALSGLQRTSTPSEAHLSSIVAQSSSNHGNQFNSTPSHLHSSLSLTPSSSNSGHQFNLSFSSRAESSSVLGMRPPNILSPDIERVRASSAMDTINRGPSPSIGTGFRPPPPIRKLQTPPTSKQNQLVYGHELQTQSPPLQCMHQEPEVQSSISTRFLDFQSSQSQYGQHNANATRDGEHHAMSSTVHDMSRPRESEMSYDANALSQQFAMGSALKRSSTTQGSQAANSHGYEPLSQIRHHSTLNDSMYRPMSTPLTGSQYDLSRLDMSSWIPPKRDLPFPKAKEPKKPEASASVSRQVTFSEAPKSIPEQRPISPELGSARAITSPPATKTPPPAAAKTTRKRAATRKKTGTAAPAPREIPDSEERVPTPASVLPEEPVSPLASKGPAISRPATAPPSNMGVETRKRAATTNIAPPAKVSRMIDSSTQTQTGSGRDHTALPRSMTINQPPPVSAVAEEPAASIAVRSVNVRLSQQQHHAQQLTPQQTAAELDQMGCNMEKFVEKFAQPRRSLEVFELPGWDTATQDERDAILENWMIEQLQDPKFIELCSTMERNWHRIAIP